MPGHIIKAKCSCGYEKELMPGAGGFGGKSYAIAYSEDMNRIGTYEGSIAKRESLVTIKDPFLDDSKLFEFDDESDNSKRGDTNKILCPRCKNKELRMLFLGFWD